MHAYISIYRLQLYWCLTEFGVPKEAEALIYKKNQAKKYKTKHHLNRKNDSLHTNICIM